MTRDELSKEIFKVSHLTGSFKLRSGQVSNEYFDKYQFESRPDLLRAIAKGMVALLPKQIDYLGAMEMGGIPIATAIALETGLPMIFVRKSAKDYGTCKFAEGPSIREKRICLIEDVITTGGQVAISAGDLRSEGAIITDVVAVLDRSNGKIDPLLKAGLTLKTLFTAAELRDTAKSHG